MKANVWNMGRRFDRDDLTGVLALVFILAVLSFIVWCFAAGAPQLTEGICIDKTHDPGYTAMRGYTAGSSDSQQVVFYPDHRPATWAIQVSGATEAGKARTEWWPVGEAMYFQIQIGDTVKRLQGGVIITRQATP